MSKQKASDFWWEYLSESHICGLCGNSGRLILVDRELKQTGEKRPCICPNGRAFAEMEKSKIPPSPEAEQLPTNYHPDIDKALEIAANYSQIDGAHHKGWCIDQMVRALTGINYSKWVSDYENGDDGPETYSWDTGIAP